MFNTSIYWTQIREQMKTQKQKPESNHFHRDGKKGGVLLLNPF
jgi:hypothetical protein